MSDILKDVKAALDAHERNQCGCTRMCGFDVLCVVARTKDWLRALVERCDLLADQLHGIQTCGHERRYEIGGQLAECVRCELEAAEARIKSLVDRCEKAEAECVRTVLRLAVAESERVHLRTKRETAEARAKWLESDAAASRASADCNIAQAKTANAAYQEAQLRIAGLEAERDHYRTALAEMTAKRDALFESETAIKREALADEIERLGLMVCEADAREEAAFKRGYSLGYSSSRYFPGSEWNNYKARTR